MYPKRYFNNVFAFISSLGVRVGLFGLLGFIDAGRGGPSVGILASVQSVQKQGQSLRCVRPCSGVGQFGVALGDGAHHQLERLRARPLDRAAARGSRPLAPA